ncbi:hypothetical protein GMRT_10772 [Giardia muris]|uniref:Uncharacterized protein n=1 Tax=Giardia muris TaxID=5742 RepID=A0A4Z1SYT8_GIAMU|nr:hypothetical protein GMRT_10772 [Giardia muris]|eukprot:TNJ30640.1 hypothetical protein GMRT_10772 [Giardia muris]
MLEDTDRVRFSQMDDDIVYTVDVEEFMDKYPSLEEVQLAREALVSPDPMAQLKAIEVLAAAPYAFDDSPIAAEIFDEFSGILANEMDPIKFHAVCDAVAACLRSVSPIACTNYAIAMLTSLTSRLTSFEVNNEETNPDVDEDPETACTLMMMLVSTCNSVLETIFDSQATLLYSGGTLLALGTAMGELYYTFLRLYIFHANEIRLVRNLIDPRLGNIPSKYLVLLDSSAVYVTYWAKCVNAMPVARNGLRDTFLVPGRTESFVFSMPLNTDFVGADSAAEIFTSPAIINFIGNDDFAMHLLKLSPGSTTSRILGSHYLATLYLNLIVKSRLYEERTYYTVFLACLGVLEAEATVTFTTLHPSVTIALLTYVIDETCPPSYASRQLVGRSEQKKFNLSTRIDYSRLEIDTKTTLPPLRTQQKMAETRPMPKRIFVAEKKAPGTIRLAIPSAQVQRLPDSRIEASRRTCKKLERLHSQLTQGDDKPPRTDPNNEEMLETVKFLALDLFLDTLSKYPVFEFSQIIATTLADRYAPSHLPITFCRILGSPCFAPFVKVETAQKILNKTTAASLDMLGKGLLSSSGAMLKSAITIRFVALQQGLSLSPQAHTCDALRQTLAQQAYRNCVQRSGVLCATLLDGFPISGLDKELFFANVDYRQCVVSLSDVKAGTHDVHCLDFTRALLDWLGVDGPLFEAWLNTQENRHIMFARLLTFGDP